MRGVLVVGAGLDSGEIPVAAACARATGAPLFSELPATEASPAIAARHAGTALDPATLVERARAAAPDGQMVVAAAPGGLMAPITEHYSVRDLARELALPLVIAARASGGVTGQVRLVAEAARSAGLRVAAVVLTGWPDPPNRVQLDERDLLARTGRAPLFTLPDGGDADGWPVEDWAAAAEAPQPGEPQAPAAPATQPESAPIVLDPYDAWRLRDVGDPRNTPRPKIMEAMLEIIGAEGPMTATRAYSLYNRAAGGRKLTSVARAPLSSAVYWLAREGKLALTKEADIPWQGDDVVRLPDQPAVRVRELGPRDLDEVPLDEIAELIGRLRANGTTEAAELKRAVLSTYGLKRLTTHADEYLTLALDL